MTIAHPFCPGYPAPYDDLVNSYPAADVYPSAAFRTEWGPIFHRGRLDGSAEALVLGQDPAVEENVTRRILIGVAGQRVQGLLSRLGLTRSYVMINTFLYSLYGQSGSTYVSTPAIVTYRNQWLSTLMTRNPIRAVITLGTLAETAFTAWRDTLDGAAYSGLHAALLHPTYPESASAHGQNNLAQATERLLANWNASLPGLTAAISHPDQPPDTTPYGDVFTAADLPPIPEADLPPGIPAWMRTDPNWATRAGSTSSAKRSTIQIVAPLPDSAG